jgi:hypothetical protein
LWKVLPKFLHECHKVVLLLARGVDVGEEQDLRMTAGHSEDATGIIALGVSLLLLLVSCIPSLLTAVNSVGWCMGVRLDRSLLPSLGNLIPGLVYLLRQDEVAWIVGDGAISS